MNTGPIATCLIIALSITSFVASFNKVLLDCVYCAENVVASNLMRTSRSVAFTFSRESVEWRVALVIDIDPWNKTAVCIDRS